jgi:hypothetical protein
MAIKSGTPLGKFPPPPQIVIDDTWKAAYDRVQRSLVAMLEGRTNATGEVLIEAGDSPLTVLDPRAGETMAVFLMIQSADLANNFIYWISDVSNGSFTIEFTHSGQMSPALVRYLLQG